MKEREFEEKQEATIGMLEIKVGGEELNGLGAILKQVMEETIQDPGTWKTIRRLQGTLVVRERESQVAVHIDFHQGEIQIQNGSVDKPTAYVEGGFEELSAISSGQVGPIRALLGKKIKTGGNLWKLLRMSKVIINRKP